MVRERQYLNKQASSNSQSTSNQANNNGQQVSVNMNSNINQNQQMNAGNHSKKNSQSNIFSYRKSPQSQLNDIVHQNKGQQNIIQKGIDTRFQKDQQLQQQHQHQQLQQHQEGYQQIYNNDKSNSKGDVIGKFQNGFKHFNQMIQNVDRESNLQKEQQQHLQQQQQSQFQQQQQIQAYQLNTSQANISQKRINSPVSQLQGQNVSHRQSIVSGADDLKRSVIQGYSNQQNYQNQPFDQEVYQNIYLNHNHQIQNQIAQQNNNSSINNNYDPNENLSILASKLSEIAQNFSSPGKKINTGSSSSHGNYPTIPPSAMKNSSVMVGNNNQTYSNSMQSSRHASGNLYAGSQLSIQQQQQNQQQQGKGQNASQNLNSLKYSQIMNTNSQNNTYLGQHNHQSQQHASIMAQMMQEQQNSHSSPQRYLLNGQQKPQPSSLATSATATQKKSNPQLYQIQAKQQNLAGFQDNSSNSNNVGQEVKPFITDRAVYNQSSNQYQNQQVGQNNSLKTYAEANNQNSNTGNKQQRKGAFNNNLTKKKRHEMKEYRHFQSIDFKNSEQNSLINNTVQNNHNTSTSNTLQNQNNTISHNISQIRNINQAAQNNYNNQVNSISAANSYRQQKNPINQFITSTSNPLISIQQKHQLMQANQLINSITGHNNSQLPSFSLTNINGSMVQDNKSIQQDTQQFSHVAPNPSNQSTQGNAAILSSQIGQNQQQSQQSNSTKNAMNQMGKQIQNINQSQMMQKFENSPNTNGSNRQVNSNRSNTQRTQSNIILNQATNQPQFILNTQATNNSSNTNNSNNQLPLNSAKSTGGPPSSKSGNKFAQSLLQPSYSPGHQNINTTLSNQARVQSATSNANNSSIQNKPASNIHNTNLSLQNNYLLNQKASKLPNPQSQITNNSILNGSNNFGKSSQNLFGNLSMNNNNFSISNSNNNNNINSIIGGNTTGSPNTQNVIKNSSSTLNIKIQKQLQQQSQSQQQQALLSSSIAAYKKQGGSTSNGGIQQPLSAKSGEQQIKERRKHSESTALHSHSANNSNPMIITNLSQGKYFEEDIVKEQQSLSLQKNIQGVSQKGSLKSSQIYPNNISTQTNSLTNKSASYQQQQQNIQDSSSSQLEKIKQIQQRLKIGGTISNSKTPDRDRYPLSASSSRKYDLLKQSKTPSDNRITQNLNSSPNSINLDLSQHRDLQKNNSKPILDSKLITTPENSNIISKSVLNYQQNLSQSNKSLITQVRGFQQTEGQQNDVIGIDHPQEEYQFTLQNPDQQNTNFVQQQFSNISLPQPQEIKQQNNNNNNNFYNNNDNNNQEFSHHLNNIEQSNQQLLNNQNFINNQIQQQQQNLLKRKNPTSHQSKNQPQNSINSSQYTSKSNQNQDQFNQMQIHHHHLSESNNMGSSEASKTNNSHQSFVNPTNNSFYNPIKLQTIDSMIIPHPSQVLHTGMTADKVAALAFYGNQQNDESMGDYHEYADQSVVPVGGILSNSQGMNQANIRNTSPNNYIQKDEYEYDNSTYDQQSDNHRMIAQLNDNQQQQQAYIQQNYGSTLPSNQEYKGEINMQSLEKVYQQQKLIQNKSNQSPIQQSLPQHQNIHDNQKAAALWREMNYKQQQQDLNKFETLYDKQKQQQAQQQSTSNNNTTLNTQNNNLNINSAKNNKNLKQQLEELNINQHPLLSNITAEKGEDKSGQKKSNSLLESSDKKRAKTPQSQPNKIVSPLYNLSSTNRGNPNNQFRIQNEETNSSVNSSAKKNKKPLPKSSPSSSSQKSNIKMPNSLTQEPSINKNQHQNNSRSQTHSSGGKKGSSSPSSSQVSPQLKQQQAQNFKINDLLDDLLEEKNIDLIDGDDDQFQFQYETLQGEDQFQKLLNQPTNYNDLFEGNGKNESEQNNKIEENRLPITPKDNDDIDYSVRDDEFELNELRKQIENINQIMGKKEFAAPNENNQFHVDLIQTLSDHKHKINQIVYNHEDNIIFTASHDYTLKAFTQQSQESTEFSCIQTIRHKRWVTSLQYISSARMLLSGGADGMIKLFRLTQSDGYQDRYPQNILSTSSFVKGHSGTVTGLKYLSNEMQNLVSCGVDGFINLWDLETLQIKSSWDTQSQISNIEWIPQGNLLLNLNQSSLQIMDIRTSQIISQTRNSDFTCIKRLPHLETGYLVGTGQYNSEIVQSVNGLSSTPSILQFDMRKDSISPSIIHKPLNGSKVNCIEIYENQNMCIYGTDESLEYINFENNKVHILDSQVPSVNCLSIDTIHDRIYSGSSNQELRIYNTF